MDETLVRVHIWVKGHVQGVGFRAFVADSAGFIGVNGWVRNVNWDTVEALAEGSRAQVDQFIQAVKTGPRASRVNECRVEEEPATQSASSTTQSGSSISAEFTGFEIRSSR